MNKKMSIILYILCGISTIGMAVVYPLLPAEVPIHWNAESVADNWAEKWVVFPFGLLPAALLLLMQIMPKIDPKSANFARHQEIYSAFSAAMTVFMLLVSWMIPLGGLGYELPIGSIICVLLGVIFTTLGNFMPKIKHNYSFGIRTPWTLASETVWRKTHRIGGVFFMLSGIIMVISGFISNETMIAAIAVMLVGVIACSVYSWYLYKKETNQ